MKIESTMLEGVFILEPSVFGDERGWFYEVWSKRDFKDMRFDIDFIQDNHSLSIEKGTIRGLHYQTEPKAQTKLVRCTKGAIKDVAVDIRKGSPTYRQWVAIQLSEENKKQILIPKGFAHGFMTLTDNVEVQYKVDEFYSPEHDGGFAWNDPSIGVEWGIANPVLSEKDRYAPLFKDCTANFYY